MCVLTANEMNGVWKITFKYIFFFNLLTVHLGIFISVINQLDT